MIKKITLLICLLVCYATVNAQTYNESQGTGAGASITTGDYNTAYGDSTLHHLSSGSYNTAMGFRAGYNITSGSEGVYIGYQAGFTDDNAYDNTMIGFRAGYYNTATDNTFIGNTAGFSNTEGYDNTIIGQKAGVRLTTGDDNTFIGDQAGGSTYGTVGVTTETVSGTPNTGSDNTAVGADAGLSLTTGYRNVFVGSDAGEDVEEGARNTAVGDSAGVDIGAGNANTMIGQGAGAATEHADFNTFVGAGAGWDNNRTNNTNDANRNTYVGAATGHTNREGEDNVGMGAFADFGGSGQPGTDWLYGAGNLTEVSRATFIGASADAGANDVTLLGFETRVDDPYGIAIGSYARVEDANSAIGIGHLSALSDAADYSVGIGKEVNISEDHSVGIGRAVDIDNTESVALGANAVVQNDGAIVIGYGANSMDLKDDPDGIGLPDATNTIAIGHSAAASGFYSVAIGSNANAASDNTMVLGGATNPLSVGIGTDAPNAYASLELADTNKGLLVNRLTTAQKTTLEGNLTATDYGMLVYDTDLKGLYVWDGTQWTSALADNLGDHIATNTLDLDNNIVDNVNWLITANGSDNGIRLRNNTNYTITAANDAIYKYGPVTGYSIKNSITSTSGNGWTWGVNNQTPIAAIDNTGKMQIANTMTIGAYTLPNTDGTTDQLLSTDGSGAVTWVDATVNTDEQDLSLSSDILSLTNDATSVDLSGYLDNTDNQDLTISNHVLSLSNDATPVDLLPYVNTDTQLTEAQVDSYVSNNGYLTSFTEVDGDITNEIQDISLSGTNLSISSGSTVDLAALQDGTGSDNQDLTSAILTNSTLSIDIESGDAVNVDLSPLLTDLEDRVTALEAAGTASGTDTTPQKFNYQAVVNDSSGDILANTTVSFQINILQGSSTGTTVYSETHSTTTSSKGLTNLLIGDGTLVSGNFTTIDWGSNVYYLEVKVDVTGGTSYVKIGVSQLVSVPYALHAQSADYLSGISSAKLKTELKLKDAKIEKLENKVEQLEAMMKKIINQ